MYWIYLLIFISTVFVPDFVTGGFWKLSEQSTEELAIFILGGIAFVMYFIKDTKLHKYMMEKAKAQRDASRMSKDLTTSYSYIGEINRKLEIFKSISLGLPVWTKITKLREDDAFEHILSSIKAITRAEEYSLRFVDKDSLEILSEIKSKEAGKTTLSIKEILDHNKKYFETDDHTIAVSPTEVRGVICVLTIKKKRKGSFSEDPDILKAVASQALLLYMFSRRERHKK